MNKINFVSDQAPGISGPNLNLMQTNAENAIAQAKSEAIEYLDTGSRNLFDENNLIAGYISINSTTEQIVSDNSKTLSQRINVKGATNICFSRLNTYTADTYIFQFDNNGNLVKKSTGDIHGSVIRDTIETNTEYIRIRIDSSNANVKGKQIQLEKSLNPTPYTPYTGKYLNEGNCEVGKWKYKLISQTVDVQANAGTWITPDYSSISGTIISAWLVGILGSTNIPAITQVVPTTLGSRTYLDKIRVTSTDAQAITARIAVIYVD